MAGTRALGRAGRRLIGSPSYTRVTAVTGWENKIWQNPLQHGYIHTPPRDRRWV